MTHLAASYKGQRTDQNALEIQNHDQSMDRGCSKTKRGGRSYGVGNCSWGKGPPVFPASTATAAIRVDGTAHQGKGLVQTLHSLLWTSVSPVL